MTQVNMLSDLVFVASSDMAIPLIYIHYAQYLESFIMHCIIA